MSSQKSAYRVDASSPLGAFLKQLREERDLPLWEVASQARMDSTLLSKVERGHRCLKSEQAVLLEKFFGLPAGELERRNIAAKFWKANAGNPAAAGALDMIQEMAPAYVVNKSVNKRRKGSG